MAKTKKISEKTQVGVKDNSAKEVELAKDTFMTDEEIARKFGYDIHTWEGTVLIWRKKSELGIK